MATPTADPQIKLPQLPARELGYKSLPAFRAREFLFGDQHLEAKQAAPLKAPARTAGPQHAGDPPDDRRGDRRPDGEHGDVRRRAHHAPARRLAPGVDLLDHVPRRPVPGRSLSAGVRRDAGRDAARHGDRRVLADHRHLRPLLQPAPPPGGGDAAEWRELFGGAWTAALQSGLLYGIDLRIYEPLEPQVGAGVTRFTPSTVVVLVQDPATKALTPELDVNGGPDVFGPTLVDELNTHAFDFDLQVRRAFNHQPQVEPASVQEVLA